MRLDPDSVQRLREQAGLTPEGLAEKLSIDRTTVVHWESKKKNTLAGVNIEKLKKLAEFFQVDLSRFFIFEGKECLDVVFVPKDVLSKYIFLENIIDAAKLAVSMEKDDVLQLALQNSLEQLNPPEDQSAQKKIEPTKKSAKKSSS